MVRRPVIKIAVAIAVLGLLGYIGYMMFSPAVGNVFEDIMDDAAQTGEEFLLALKEGDSLKADALLGQELQELNGDPELMGVLFENRPIRSWVYDASTGETAQGDPVVILNGTLTLENGEELDMRLLLRNDEDGFRVVGFSFRPK